MRPFPRWPRLVLALVGAVPAAMAIHSAPAARLDWALALVGAVPVALMFGLVFRRRPATREAPLDTGGDRETVGLRPGERAVYSRRVTNPVLAVVGVAVAGVMLVTGDAFQVAGALAWLYLLAGVATVDVNVDAAGLDVRGWPLGKPRRQIPLERILGARSVPVRRRWGLSWMPSRRSWAFSLRGTSALEVRIDNGESLLVTVPDAAIAAGLINDLRQALPLP